MSAKVQGWVWDLVDLLPQRRLVLVWLANRATDNGVCFPGQAEVRRKTGLGEKMVRRHLHWLASDVDDDGNPKAPLMTIVERRIDAERNTSNVYVLHVPWAQARTGGTRAGGAQVRAGRGGDIDSGGGGRR